MTETVVFGGGCFWCTEAIFGELRGVSSVMPGYAGGDMVNPTYQAVSTGQTGHAEVINVAYDPNEIPFTTLLEVFFATHDPTTVNRQGNDVGEEYRSIIFYTKPEQKLAADNFIKQDGRPIVTEIKPLDKFYPAEDYHQNYYANNSDKPYCQLIINPKLTKLRTQYSKLLKQA
jgi:peptide-methionine (S)-S-oxide reductase